jgi:hypothetical protein
MSGAQQLAQIENNNLHSWQGVKCISHAIYSMSVCANAWQIWKFVSILVKGTVSVKRFFV